jgi:hypothetical protein
MFMSKFGIKSLLEKFSHPFNKNKPNSEERPFTIRYLLANIIYKFYGRDRNRIPFPLLVFIIGEFGGWAGVSITLARRQYSYELKLKRFKAIISNIGIISGGLLLIYGGFIVSKDSIIFGFLQNLFSDIILLVLVIYLLPKRLNPTKKVNINIEIEETYNNERLETTLYINNVGEEIYKSNEIEWEIWIYSQYLEEKDILWTVGSYELSDSWLFPSWKFTGINSTPLFIDHKSKLLTISIKDQILNSSPYEPVKIYFKFWTVNGNLPELEHVTKDFVNLGITFDNYPKFGELWVNESNAPEDYFFN